jgi:hypothetical protein
VRGTFLAGSAVSGVSASEIRAILDDLVRQRRGMGPSAEPGLREANRLSIVYWQLQLARVRDAERPRDHAAR